MGEAEVVGQVCNSSGESWIGSEPTAGCSNKRHDPTGLTELYSAASKLAAVHIHGAHTTIQAPIIRRQENVFPRTVPKSTFQRTKK